jgi:hypothetical protein
MHSNQTNVHGRLFVPSNGAPSPGVIWRQRKLANRKVSSFEQSAATWNDI